MTPQQQQKVQSQVIKPTYHTTQRKMPPQRQTLKLATVGAVGIDPPTQTHQQQYYDANHISKKGTSTQIVTAGMTEHEIIQKIVQFTNSMRQEQ